MNQLINQLSSLYMNMNKIIWIKKIIGEILDKAQTGHSRAEGAF